MLSMHTLLYVLFQHVLNQTSFIDMSNAMKNCGIFPNLKPS